VTLPVYCVNPFTRLEVKGDGGVYCCCDDWLPHPLGNVLTGDDLLQIWEGDRLREIRRSVLGEDFSYCRSCPYLPEPAGSWPLTREKPRLPAPELVPVLKLDYDRTCNLTCRSCRLSSSLSSAETSRSRLIHEAVVRSGILARTSQLYVTGSGDPFASPLYYHFLQTLHQHSPHPDLTVFLHTNGLLLNRARWEKLGETRSRISGIGISVDAFLDKTYEIVRGGSWTRLQENIDLVNQLQSSPETRSGLPVQLGFFYVVQAVNFREVESFVEWAWKRGASWVSLSALRNWGTYSTAEYRSRAVHYPGHPDHEEFRRAIARIRAARDPRVNLESFRAERTT